MTPARKAALKWFHDRGEVRIIDMEAGLIDGAPSDYMLDKLWELGFIAGNLHGEGWPFYTLTDKGSRALNGDGE